MAIHALIEKDTLNDTGKRYDIEGAPQDLSHKVPPMALVPVVVAPDPSFDPATQKLQRAADVVTLTELTESREVVAKTQEEQDAYARQQDIQAREAQAKSIYAALDSGTATGAQAQKVLAWLLKREFSDVG